MSDQLIAVEGCTLAFQLGKGVITLLTQASKHNLIDGKGVYSGPLQFTVMGYVGGTIALNGQVTGSIAPTAQYVVDLDTSQPVLRQQDQVNVVLKGQDASGNNTTQADILTVSVAGQTSTFAS